MSDTNSNQKTPSKANATDDASKVKMLVSCIKNKTNDAINWQAVAEECEILGTDGTPSKGAASKRYDRILKAYNVERSGTSKSTSTAGEDGASTPKKKASPRKKNTKQDSGAEDDGESPTKKRKTATKKKEDSEEEDAVKAEAEAE